MRKPGEPIYLRKHVWAVTAALLATLVLPRLYEWMIGPLSLEAKLAMGVVIGVIGGLGLSYWFRDSAQNEPDHREP